MAFSYFQIWRGMQLLVVSDLVYVLYFVWVAFVALAFVCAEVRMQMSQRASEDTEGQAQADSAE